MIADLFLQTEITSTAAWQRLSELAGKVQVTPISLLFEQDPKRNQKFSLLVNDIFFDYSKNQITSDIMESLLQLARARQLPLAIEGLFEGEIFNTTEQRPTLHMALRDPNASCEILAQKDKMASMVSALNEGRWLGATGKAITDVVNIGIGGSDLGPVFTTHALAAYKTSSLNIHFISNIDPFPLENLFKTLNPETTLFIISSKTWSTLETLSNANAARAWLAARLSLQEPLVAPHFIGISASFEKAIEWGIPSDQVLQFWDWVGGRYSIWSSIGLPLALTLGMPQFEAFLKGAHEMDKHFKTAPLEQNLPVLLALVGIWNTNFLGADSHAILPYDYQLKYFPDYLQQLDMESNGKSVQQNGSAVSMTTGPIIWGQMGTNGQHAFYQLLHQGTHFVPVDFIVSINRDTSLPKHHEDLIANCLAQAQALMTGTSSTPDVSPCLKPQNTMPGNRPSNLLMLESLNPKTLGALIALYEHKVFVQGFLWNINSFDQPGVELGKTLAKDVSDKMHGLASKTPVHPSTDYLLKQMNAFKQKGI